MWISEQTVFISIYDFNGLFFTQEDADKSLALICGRLCIVIQYGIRNQLDVTLRYPLFLLYKLLNMFRATTNSSMDTLPANQFWQPFCSHGTVPTRGDNTTQSSAPEDGHIVAQNMLSNLYRRNKG